VRKEIGDPQRGPTPLRVVATATVKGRCPRLRDGLTVVRGSLICALIVLSFDVVLDGSYLFSAVVCPIWLLVSLFRAVVRRPTLGVAAARVVIPLVTGLLVVANYSV
jgi:hypothetical protein